MRRNPVDIAKARPAETAAPPAMAIAVLICKAIGVDDVDTIGWVAILVAFVPTVVTFLVDLLKGKS
jgi:hypothetical protein